MKITLTTPILIGNWTYGDYSDYESNKGNLTFVGISLMINLCSHNTNVNDYIKNNHN